MTRTYDLMILDGGPAGLTAAVCAWRRRLNALLVAPDLGGKTDYRVQLPFVEKHLVITGQEVVSRLADQVEQLELAREFGQAEKVEKIKGGHTITTRARAKHIAKAALSTYEYLLEAAQ